MTRAVLRLALLQVTSNPWLRGLLSCRLTQLQLGWGHSRQGDFVARVKDIVKNASQEVVLVIDLIDTSKPKIDVNINNEVMTRQLVWRSRVGL